MTFSLMFAFFSSLFVLLLDFFFSTVIFLLFLIRYFLFFNPLK